MCLFVRYEHEGKQIRVSCRVRLRVKLKITIVCWWHIFVMFSLIFHPSLCRWHFKYFRLFQWKIFSEKLFGFHQLELFLSKKKNLFKFPKEKFGFYHSKKVRWIWQLRDESLDVDCWVSSGSSWGRISEEKQRRQQTRNSNRFHWLKHFSINNFLRGEEPDSVAEDCSL